MDRPAARVGRAQGWRHARCTQAGSAARALLSGTMVTRLRSCPRASSAFAVASLSTTTCA